MIFKNQKSIKKYLQRNKLLQIIMNSRLIAYTHINKSPFYYHVLNKFIKQVINMKPQQNNHNTNLVQSINPQHSYQQSLKQKSAISTLQHLIRSDKNNFVQHIENVSQNQRHGLFTQPPNLAIGDKYFDKKPQQCKKNMQINKKLQDRVQPQLFSRLGSTNLGDPYKDTFRGQQLYDKEKVDLIPHSQSFLPTQNRKTIKNSEFEHMKQFDDKVYNTRDQNGKVKIAKRNFSTNPMKRGYGSANHGHLFGEYQYIPSQYDAEREKQFKERAEHKAKIIAPFVSYTHTKHLFTQNHHAFNKAIVDPYNQIKPQKIQTTYGPWRATNPSKKGYEKTFQKFPQYIQQGQKSKNPIKHENVWIHNYNGTSTNYRDTLSRPCPAPSQLILNEIRRQK